MYAYSYARALRKRANGRFHRGKSLARHQPTDIDCWTTTARLYYYIYARRTDEGTSDDAAAGTAVVAGGTGKNKNETAPLSRRGLAVRATATP